MNIEEQNTLKAEEDDEPLVDVSTELKLGIGEDGESSVGDDDELRAKEVDSAEHDNERSAEEVDSAEDDDELSGNEEEDEVFCYCGRAAILRVSYTSKNPNREFYCCPKPQHKTCGFFQWSDEPLPHREKHANDGKSDEPPLSTGYKHADKMTTEEQNTLKAEEDAEPLVDVSTEIKLGIGEDGECSAGDDDELGADEVDSAEEEDDELSSDEEEDEVFCYCDRAAILRTSYTSKNPNRDFYCCPKRSRKTCGFFQWADEPLPYREKHANDGKSDEPPLSTGDKHAAKVNIDQPPLSTGDKKADKVSFNDPPLSTGDKNADKVNFNEPPPPTFHKHFYGVNSTCSACIQLGYMIEGIQQQRNAERAAWYKERTELTLMLSHMKVELEEIKKRVPPDVKNVKQENGIKKRVKEEIYKSDNMPPADKKVKQEDDVKDIFDPLPPMIKKVKQEDEN